MKGRRPCIHGNLCRAIYKLTGCIYSVKCPYGCEFYEPVKPVKKVKIEGAEEIKDGLYTRHEVACIIADLFGGTCACDYSGNDEWLPQYCEFADNVCPNTVGVACWEQYLAHIDKKAGEQSE